MGQPRLYVCTKHAAGACASGVFCFRLSIFSIFPCEKSKKSVGFPLWGNRRGGGLTLLLCPTDGGHKRPYELCLVLWSISGENFLKSLWRSMFALFVLRNIIDVGV